MAQVINETHEKQTSCTCTAEDLQFNSIRFDSLPDSITLD